MSNRSPWYLTGVLAIGLSTTVLRAAEPAPQAKSEAEPAAAAKAPVVHDPVVKLVEAGKGERRVLGFQIVKGWKEAAVMVMRVEMTSEAAGIAMPSVKMPASETTLKVEVTDVMANGDFTYSFEFVEVKFQEEEGVSPLVLQRVKSQMDALKGLTGAATVTKRGLVKKVDVKIPETAAPQLRQTIDSTMQSLKSFSTPMPEDAVGLGAKWEVTQLVDATGLSVTQVTTYEVTDLRDEQLTLKVVVRQTASPQDVKGSNAPSGPKISLLSLDLKGSGEMVIDLRRVLPEKSALEMKGEYKMKIELGGQAREMNTKAALSTNLKRA
jgi:hypothetical protein